MELKYGVYLIYNMSSSVHSVSDDDDESVQIVEKPAKKAKNTTVHFLLDTSSSEEEEEDIQYTPTELLDKLDAIKTAPRPTKEEEQASERKNLQSSFVGVIRRFDLLLVDKLQSIPVQYTNELKSTKSKAYDWLRIIQNKAYDITDSDRDEINKFLSYCDEIETKAREFYHKDDDFTDMCMSCMLTV
jgi:hypothetical protein